jgi:glycosyltransferase domain-containing protein
MKTTDDTEVNCTFFIPTYNRPGYLKRILKYYDGFRKAFNIVIADSSSDEIKKANAKTINSFKNINIKHLTHYPTTINPYHKFADMVNYSTNEFSVFCADDDFVVPNGVSAAVKYLANKDFTCAHGNYISFKIHEKTKEYYWKPIYPYVSITFEDAKERFQFHLEHYYQTLYAVHRTDFLQMIFKEIITSDVDPMQFGELLPDMLTLIYGKMKRLDVFYMARAVESRVAYWPTLFEYKNKGLYEKEYLKFKNCIAAHLVKNTHLNENQAKEMIDETMQKYLANAKQEDSFSKLSILTKKMHLPIIVDNTIKNVYKKMVNPYSREQWTTKEPAEYIEDFNKIKTLVLQD